jgi:hypothetical protein
MKKEENEIYVVLSREISGNLCAFCHFAEWEGSGCDGYSLCDHPENVPGRENLLEPGDDCWGFQPSLSIEDVADIVGIVLSKNAGHGDWFYRRNDKGIKVYAGVSLL